MYGYKSMPCRNFTHVEQKERRSHGPGRRRAGHTGAAGPEYSQAEQCFLQTVSSRALNHVNQQHKPRITYQFPIDRDRQRQDSWCRAVSAACIENFRRGRRVRFTLTEAFHHEFCHPFFFPTSLVSPFFFFFSSSRIVESGRHPIVIMAAGKAAASFDEIIRAGTANLPYQE